MLVKGKDHVELIADQPKEAVKDTKVPSKPTGIKPIAAVKPKTNDVAQEKTAKTED